MNFSKYVKDNTLEVPSDVNTSKHISELVSFLQSNTHVTKLDLSCNRIGNEGAKALTNLSSLKCLDLRSNEISDEGTIALAESLCLKNVRIFIEDNPIGIKGMKVLAESEDHFEINDYSAYNGYCAHVDDFYFYRKKFYFISRNFSKIR